MVWFEWIRVDKEAAATRLFTLVHMYIVIPDFSVSHSTIEITNSSEFDLHLTKQRIIMKDTIQTMMICSFPHLQSFLQRSTRALSASDDGMATAEYAIVLVGATSFAGILVALLKSDAIRSLISQLITNALSMV